MAEGRKRAAATVDNVGDCAEGFEGGSKKLPSERKCWKLEAKRATFQRRGSSFFTSVFFLFPASCQSPLK